MAEIVDARKVELLAAMLKDGCPGDEVQGAYDFSRSAQFYRVAALPSGALRHRIFASKEFLDDHSLAEIKDLLTEWRMLDKVRAAGARAVIITNGGIEIVGT